MYLREQVFFDIFPLAASVPLVGSAMRWSLAEALIYFATSALVKTSGTLGNSLVVYMTKLDNIFFTLLTPINWVLVVLYAKQVRVHNPQFHFQK